MIDSGTTWYLILQNVVKQHRLVEDDNLLWELKVLGNFKIWIYQCHNMVLQTWDKHDHQAMTVVVIIGTNFTDCNLILKIPWLQAAKPTIKWEDENFTFPEPDGKLPVRTRPKKIQKPKVSARRKSSCSSANTQPLDIAMVSLEKLTAICEAEGLDAFMIDWRDLKNMVSVKWKMDTTMSALVSAVITPNNVTEKPSSTVLLEKYSDFSDVFDKVRADKLPCHSEHDLAIKTEKDKQPLFGPTYNHSQLELEVLCKYINKMLGKKFIIPSKLPTGALVLFTKKKDDRLRLCVGYRSLNAITKKNKHFLSLVQTLLDFLKKKKSIQSWILYPPTMHYAFVPAISKKLRLDVGTVTLSIALYLLDWWMLPRPSKPISIWHFVST